MPLEDLALATVDEVAPTHARVHWPVVALQGTELAGLDDQVEYQVLAREVSLPGRAAARRCRWATATGRWSAPRGRPQRHGGRLPGHRYEWKVRARLSGAGYLFGQSDAGSPTAAPEDVESSPTAETVVLPEQDLGQPTRQALAEDDAVTGPGPAAVRLTGPRAPTRAPPVAELAGDGHTTALDVIALPAELNGTYSWVDSESYSPETAASWEMPLEDLALATVDEVAPTHARVHWPVVALQGTELAGLDDQVEYQVLARERPGAAPTARRATGGCGSTRPRPHGGALQPGHRYEWKVRARLSGAGYLFGQSDAGSPTAAPEDVESSPTAETVVLPEQDLGQPTVSLVGPHRLRVAWQRQALAEDDAVTGPGVRYHVWARCTSCAGSPAAVRLTGATSADASAPRGRNGTYSWVDSESYSPETAASWEMPLEDLALATVDEVAPTHARVHWPVVALQGTELAGLDDQVEYQVLAREVSLPGRAAARRCRWATATGRWSAPPGPPPTARRATGGCGSTRPRPHGGALQPGHRYEWKVRARLSGAGYLFGQSDAGSPTAAPEDVEQPHGRDGGAARAGPGPAHGEPGGPHRLRVAWLRQALAEDDAVTGPGCGTTTAPTAGWTASRTARDGGQLGDALEDLALATVDEVAPTHARVHWPVVALQGTELAGLDDQVEYQVLAREVSLPGAGGAPVPVGDGNWTVVSAPGRPNGTAGDCPATGTRKVRARLSGAGYLFGQSDAGSPTAAPEDVESSPTAETVVLPEQDLGQPTVSLVGPHRLRVAWQRQALAEDDGDGPRVRYHVGPVHQLRGQPAAVRLTGPRAPTRAPRGRAGGRRAHDGPGCDCPAGRAERHLQLGGQRVVQPRDGGQLGDALEDLALATVDEVAPTHARVHWPVVALQGTELAGLDDQVEYQVLAREVSLPGAGGGAPVPVGDGNWTVSARGRPQRHGGRLVDAGRRGHGPTAGPCSPATERRGQPHGRPEDVEQPTAETVVLPEQDPPAHGEPGGPHRLRVAWQRQALAEDDAVTGPGCGTTGPVHQLRGQPGGGAADGATSADASPVAELAGDGHTTALDDCPAGRAASQPRDGGQLGDALEDLALATDEVAPRTVHWPVVALQGTELAGLDDQVDAPGRPNGTAGDWWMRVDAATAPRRGPWPGHRYEWKVRARLSGAGYLFGQSDAGSPTAARRTSSSPTAETVVLPEQDLGQPTVSLVGPTGCGWPGSGRPGRGRRGDGPRGTTCGPVHQLRGQPGGGAADGATSADASAPVAELAGDGHTTALM
ncbi:hypothetical protein PAPYR_12736 [Paratrimastix pyriformis]|uniref:Fibronectin type-III domain-containing protein n=1 Tax=Paratrimastix pyriformis TaxID=342808 RepID=A0ABQ8U3L3_9EUKA|nr:hypothetical protein PAPYR_12736 [Paratrimastix pyriformis]